MLIGYFIGGVLLCAGFVVVVESIKPLKWVVVRSTAFIDLIIFGVSVFALFGAGVTIAMVMAFAGLTFSLVYAPIIRYQHRRDRAKVNSNN